MVRLKILWFNWRCWLNPEMGGAEVFTHEVAKRWVEAGHEVALFTSEFPNCKKEEVLDGVTVVRSGGRFSVYWRAKKYYRERFSKEGYDVVVDEINTRPFFTPKFVNNGEKIVALIHQLAREYWFYETPFPVSYIGYYSLEDRWLQQYVGIPTVTVSESTRMDLVDLGFKRVFVVPEGFNFEPLEVMPEKESKPVIVLVGRLRRAKRPDHAIRAFNIVRAEVPEAELWVLGDGSFRRKLERIAGSSVRFFGNLGDVERRELIGRSWVLVNPSVREGWGLNVIEANALGLPCVAYDVAGLRDSVKNGETGLLAESGNVEDLGAALVRVLGDEGLRMRLSKNALEYSRQFSWDKTAKEFLKVLEWAVNEG
ncbi:MAG: glycosyltransferase family 4 protein [Candidatus Bathyarchaeota archaeon]|nr:glycosyltransferase family 4 protein [Candidatus Bathyarchaeota archaeon]